MFWLIPGKLAGRAGPEVEPWDLSAIRKAGVTAIVSMDEGCEAMSIKKAGLRHIPRYLPQTYPTTPALVDYFAGIVRDAADAVLHDIRAGGCILVHCYAGRDRTGLVLCASLMHLENISAADALKRVREVRPTALTAPGVLDVLREYELRLKSS